jgi:hypothetical protein
MIGITFIASDFKRVMGAIEKVRRAVRIRAYGIGYQMSSDYLQLLVLNILSQKYSGSYSAYNPLYEAWKRNNSSDMRFWILAGDLIDSLTIWKTKTGWTAGIPAGVVDSGGKNFTGTGSPKYIAAYARILEYGGTFKGQTHSPRPVFAPTFKEYLQMGTKKRLNESATIILRNWS